MKKDAVNPVKWLRFAVATLSLAAMIGLFACPTVACVRHFGWLPRIQFLPAVAAGSVLALVGIAVSVALCGRLYCSVVCPLGIAQDVVRLCFGRIVPRKAGFTRFAHLKEDISIFNEKPYKPMTAAEHAAYAESIKLEVGNGEGVPCSGCK